MELSGNFMMCQWKIISGNFTFQLYKKFKRCLVFMHLSSLLYEIFGSDIVREIWVYVWEMSGNYAVFCVTCGNPDLVPWRKQVPFIVRDQFCCVLSFVTCDGWLVCCYYYNFQRMTFEPSHEIMVLFILHKLILQTRMHSYPVGLDVWFLVGPFFYFHTSCVGTARALARLCRCAGLPKPSLVAYVISTIISCAGSFTYIHSSANNQIRRISSQGFILWARHDPSFKGHTYL